MILSEAVRVRTLPLTRLRTVHIAATLGESKITALNDNADAEW